MDLFEGKTKDRQRIKQESPLIGREQIVEAERKMKEYQQKLDPLYKRLIENEKWWQLFNFEVNGLYRGDGMEPSSAWLFNCIISKHADAMDCFPEANILPREEGDIQEAKKLTCIIPALLKGNRFEKTYSDVNWYKIKGGTGCYGVFWDPNKLNGMGDISIKKVDLLNLAWEPGIKDIQESDNVFYATMVDNKKLENIYGDKVKGKLGGNAYTLQSYDNYERKDTSELSCVVDWYYKKYINGRTVLHYCKFVNDVVLYATENETEPVMDEEGNILKEPAAVTGLYDHGMYPFVFDVLFPLEGKVYGFGYVDVCRHPQKYIDMLNKALMKNANYGATPRALVSEGAKINEEEYLDPNKPIVHVPGSVDDTRVKIMPYKSLDAVYVTLLNNKIEELKETSGNRDVNNGGTAAGVTAASAIAAMQEQSGKTSRDATRTSYWEFEQLVNMVIELIRQFYDVAREFRIIGESGANEFISYDNSGLKVDQGIEMRGQYRLPVFDLQISAQKSSPYTKLSQNELILDLYSRGFFQPDNADQALAAVEFMDFPGKDKLVQKLSQNQTMLKTMAMMQQQMLQMAEIIDKTKGTNLAEQMGAGIMGGAGATAVTGNSSGIVQTESDSLGSAMQEHGNVTRAREQAQAATQPG